ncbi:hypothetical protein TcWFU_003834 [Taenia crassiceps]|uniref:Uncharacterized protein n=1 Tax=Taenia crassiceps TaxID=6207 RepID=A0ABR4Q5J9_9CEST
MGGFRNKASFYVLSVETIAKLKASCFFAGFQCVRSRRGNLTPSTLLQNQKVENETMLVFFAQVSTPFEFDVWTEWRRPDSKQTDWLTLT